MTKDKFGNTLSVGDCVDFIDDGGELSRGVIDRVEWNSVLIYSEDIKWYNRKASEVGLVACVSAMANTVDGIPDGPSIKVKSYSFPSISSRSE